MTTVPTTPPPTPGPTGSPGAYDAPAPSDGSAADVRGPLARAVPPTRRAPRSRRRTLALLVVTGLGLVGVVALLASWVGVGVRTVQAGAAAEPGTCLAAYEARDDDASVRFGIVPARAVCAWDVDGSREEVVVAAAPTVVVVGGLVLLLGGVAGAAVAVLPARSARSTVGGAPAHPSDAP
jgi:hypothetical protein